jgi:hypothetical protein
MKPSTPVVLYASDYGFHTGNILWRGHFVSIGSESSFSASLIGGSAFGFSAWLNGTFIGSWEGDSTTSQQNKTFTFARLAKGKNYVITVLQDHMGLEEDWAAAGDQFKTPRGIIAYSFPGSAATTVTTWKVTGNLGGEDVSFFWERARLQIIDAWCSTSTRPVVRSTKADSTVNVRAGTFPGLMTATGRLASPLTASHKPAFSSTGSFLVHFSGFYHMCSRRVQDHVRSEHPDYRRLSDRRCGDQLHSQPALPRKDLRQRLSVRALRQCYRTADELPHS